MKKEDVASALFGGLALFSLLLAFIKLGQVQPHVIIFVFAFGMEGIALALAPAILFERITLKELRSGKGLTRYGAAAIFSILAKTCFLLGGIFFILSMFG